MAIAIQREGAVTHLQLSRPEAGNAIDLASAAELDQSIQRAELDGTRVIVLSAMGKAFCAGGDLAAIAQAEDVEGFTAELADTLHAALHRLAQSDVLLVSAVQGIAAGAGLGLVLNSDYVVASSDAAFLAAYAGVGVSPDAGSTFLLPRIVGRRRAAEVILFGRRIDAQTAHEWGLVNEVVAPADCVPTALALAERVAVLPAQALSASKQLLDDAFENDYGAHLARESASIAALMTSPEATARRLAFLSPRT